MAVQDKKLLTQDKRIEFLTSLQPYNEYTFGKKFTQRSEEPPMAELLSGGYDAYIKNDYTKNRAELSNKIKKMKREKISEAHDNFRKPQQQQVILNDDEPHILTQHDVNELLLFNYFDLDELDQYKKKIFMDKMVDAREKRNKTIYIEHYKGTHDLREKNKEIRQWTAAGAPSRKEQRTRGQLVMP